MKSLIAVAALCLVAAADTPPAYDWGSTPDSAAPEYARSRAICRNVHDRAPPAADRPDAATERALRGCDSEALYYGIGRPADPVRARQCAFLEAQSDDRSPLGGQAMLMTIYANGVGATRDLDLATHYACQVEGAPAESDGRVTELADLARQHWTGRDFGFCGNITSGLASGYCADHEARVAGARRDAALAGLSRGWAPAEQQGLAGLRRALEAFVQAEGAAQDATGSARAAFAIEAEEAVRTDFLDKMQRLATGRAPTYSAAQYRAADARLNAVYGRIIRDFAAQGDAGAAAGAPTVTATRAAQRAWLHYRDAFIAFAALKFPAVSRDTLATWLTMQRIQELSPPTDR